jgi:hypothetical protein
LKTEFKNMIAPAGLENCKSKRFNEKDEINKEMGS